MTEENNGAPKKKWSRIFRKKWFFPAVYLTIAALLLSLVVWYQNLGNQMNESQDTNTEDYTPVENDEDVQPVMDQQEVIQMPVENQDQAEIVTKFYDYDAEQESQEDAIVVFEDRFYQSTGIDIASAEGETFDVLASLSGTVTEVKEDPLLGNVVTLTHDNDVTTHYASLGETSVSAEDTVEQGDVIATAGESIFGKENGTHVHFEIRKDGEEMNPETFFNQPVSALDEALTEDEESGNDENTESNGTDEDAGSEDATEEENAESDGTEEEDAGSEDATEEENTESDESDEDSDASGDDDEASDDTDEESDNTDTSQSAS